MLWPLLRHLSCLYLISEALQRRIIVMSALSFKLERGGRIANVDPEYWKGSNKDAARRLARTKLVNTVLGT